MTLNVFSNLNDFMITEAQQTLIPKQASFVLVYLTSIRNQFQLDQKKHSVSGEGFIMFKFNGFKSN